MKNLIFGITAVVLLFSACESEEPSEQSIAVEEAVELEEVVELENIVADSSAITCPKCGFTSIEELPTEVCLLAHDCDSCGHTMRPVSGDCCVFCTHGEVKCPSMQE